MPASPARRPGPARLTVEALEDRSTPAPLVTDYAAGTGWSFPDQVAAGPDRAVWFTQGSADRVGRVDAAGLVTEFAAGITPGAAPAGITLGPDRNLWFTQYNTDRVARITPAGEVTEFAAGITPGAGPHSIVAGPDGNLWFTQFKGDRIGRITPTGQVTEFAAGIAKGSNPAGITVGPDGNLWFTMFGAAAIGRITPAGQVTQFAAGLTKGSGPLSITAGPDGNLWFTELLGNRVGRVTTGGQVREFPLPTPRSGPHGITAGPDGGLWFTRTNAGGVAQITPDGVVTEYADGFAPTAGPRGITQGPDNALWVAQGTANRVARVTFPAPTVYALPNPAVVAGAPLVLTGSFANPDNLRVSATADYGDGGGPQPLDVTGTTYLLSRVFTVPGVYAAVVTISNGFAASSRSFRIDVAAPAGPAGGLGWAPPAAGGAVGGDGWAGAGSGTPGGWAGLGSPPVDLYGLWYLLPVVVDVFAWSAWDAVAAPADEVVWGSPSTEPGGPTDWADWVAPAYFDYDYTYDVSAPLPAGDPEPGAALGSPAGWYPLPELDLWY